MHRSRSYSSLAKSNTLTYEVTNNKSNMNLGFVTGLIDASLVNNTLSKRELSTKGPTSYSLNLEVWGTNLRSTVGLRFSLNQLAMVQIAPSKYCVIIGARLDII